MPYNYNPAPRGGQGPFGTVPGVVTPPDPARDLANQFPGLRETNAALSRNIRAGLEGQLSPATIAALQDANAAFGIMSGMPGITPGTFGSNRLGRNIGLTAEGLAQKALENYNATIPTISRTQTVDPSLLIQLAQWNAINSSAPDPGAAARYSESLYNRYLGGMGGAGGRGSFAMPSGGTRGGLQSPGVVVGNSLAGDVTGGDDFSQGDWWSSIGWNPSTTEASPYGGYDQGLMDWLDYGITDMGDQGGGGGGYNYFDFGDFGGGGGDWTFGVNDLDMGYDGGVLDYGGYDDFGGGGGYDDLLFGDW